MRFKPRPYQQKIIDDVRAELEKGNRRILIVLGTGGGKTVITTDITESCKKKGNSTMFICHRVELIDQAHNTFLKNDITPSFIAANRKYRSENKIQIASIGTLIKRIDEVINPNVCFWDECHHQAAAQWAEIFKKFGKSVHIGLTATPIRLDGKPLGEFYDVMVQGPSTRWLMDEGYLVNYKYVAPSNFDKSQLKFTKKGEVTKASLEKAGFSKKIIGDNVKEYLQHAKGRRNIVFARNVEESLDIVRRYNEAGIRAVHLDGNTPTGVRRKALEDFRNGEIDVISNVDLFGEGVDVPVLEAISIVKVTASLSNFMQMCGRPLRPIYAEGYDLETKEGRLSAIAASSKPYAIILDHGDNFLQHQLPDTIRHWTLDSDSPIKNGSPKDDDGLILKKCKRCFAPHLPALICPHCDYEYKADGKEIKIVAGELYLQNSDDFRNAMKAQVRVVETFKELVNIEKELEHKVGWAEHQWKAKTGIDLKASLKGLQEIALTRGHKRGWAYRTDKILNGKKHG